MDDMAAGKYGVFPDVRPFGQQNGLGTLPGQITVGCTAEPVIGIGQIPYQRSGIVVTESGVAIGFQYEGEVTAESLFLPTFFLRVYTGGDMPKALTW